MTFRQLAYRNVFRNRRSYAAFFLASVFSVMVFFVYSMFIFHPLFAEDGLQQLAVRGMFIAEVVLYIFTLFFLFYSMSAFLQARSKEFGILMHLGMTKKQLNKLIFFETMILGTVSTVAGIALGFAFSKFFFMIGREIMELEALPLYVSWKPFALTIGAFASLFIIISFVSVAFVRTKGILDLLQGYWKTEEITQSSKWLSALGFVLLAIAYALAAMVSDSTVYTMAFIIPPIATLGTYLFFTHSIHSLLQLYKRRRGVYWHKTRLVAIAEASVKLKDSAQMFFIVTIVSTVAFLTVGTLASFMSYTGDFRESNPLGLIYISFNGNSEEREHVDRLISQLEGKELEYDMVPLIVKRQTSTLSGNDVDIVRTSDFNRLALTLGFNPVYPQSGEGIFIPYSQESLEELGEVSVETRLMESDIDLSIDEVYPHVMFPVNTVNFNSIVVNDSDYAAIDEPLAGFGDGESTFTYYAFDIPDWEETVSVGKELTGIMQQAVVQEDFRDLNFFFVNPGKITACLNRHSPSCCSSA
ncbi:ABC transporter permease [Planococcus koreensis]|uniref:ABC transporter permease n=1 Tax=Planococcus koreensis TaxID=112331 RepID=UPI0039FD1A47